MLVVVAAAWLVWTRPGAMSWGFFLYVMWFNPGRDYAFYAILQPWPIVMLVQTVLTALAEAAGYAGLLLFVMRAPDDEPDPKWRWLERALPAVGCALAILLLAAYSPLVGYRSEIGMWAAVIAGFAIAALAVFILLERMRRLPPEDYQRLRWVIWGCMIGLPAFLFADLASTTTILDTRFGDFTPADDFIGLLYLVNGILCLFVFQAIRSERVVSVAIPLRRVTILGLTLSVPALLLHHEMDYIQKNLAIPEWAWLVIGGGVLYLITKLHEEATHFTERYFNRNVVALETRLRETILQARSATEIDRLLSEETSRGLALTSAAAFRGKGNIYRRDEAYGWDPGLARVLQRDAPLLAPLAGGKPFAISDEPVEGDPKLPEGIARPVLGVPAANPYRCFSVTLYGPHASGADLDDYERAMLGRLGNSAAAAYAEIETLALEERLAALETVPDHAPPRKRGR
jgi:hypothetical protein